MFNKLHGHLCVRVLFGAAPVSFARHVPSKQLDKLFSARLMAFKAAGMYKGCNVLCVWLVSMLVVVYLASIFDTHMLLRVL